MNKIERIQAVLTQFMIGRLVLRTGDGKYNLVHSYLVRPLRQSLMQEQARTWAGRAELRLQELAGQWALTGKQGRFLPNPLEYVSILVGVRRSKRTAEPYRQFMSMASRRYAVAALVAGALVAILALLRWQWDGRVQADGQVRTISNASIEKLPGLVDQVKPYRRWAIPLLTKVGEFGSKEEQLRARLTLLAVDPSRVEQIEPLRKALLDAQLQEVLVICHIFRSYKEQSTNSLWNERIVDPLWEVVEKAKTGRQRFRAAYALAAFDPHNPHWTKIADEVVGQLLAESPIHLPLWIEGFAPVGLKLVDPLCEVFHNPDKSAERSLAAGILAEYIADRPDKLAELAMGADASQYRLLWPKLEAKRDEVARLLKAELAESKATATLELKQAGSVFASPSVSPILVLPFVILNPGELKDDQAKRKANAAVTLIRFGKADEEVWRLFRHSHDPRVCSFLVHALGPREVDPEKLIERLSSKNREQEPEQNISAQRALILSLGEFRNDQVAPESRSSLAAHLEQTYMFHPDPGIHGAAEWLLRHWQHEDKLKEFEQEWMTHEHALKMEERIESIRKQLASDEHGKKPQWYVNSQGQTIVVVPVQEEFLMGSPVTEQGREADEQLHEQRVGQKGIRRTFAIAAKPVTVEQFLRFRKDYRDRIQYRHHVAPTDDCPVHGTSWHEVAAYCNWLSLRDGLKETDLCFKPEESSESERKRGESEVRMKLVPDYLNRTGYRMPTEAEWEFACRAGAVTSRYYGQSEELLRNYGWFIGNSTKRSWPVGRLKPNDYGLFDMHGSVWTWCQERYRPYRVDLGPAHLIMQTVGAQGLGPAGTPAAAPVQCLAALGVMNSRALVLPKTREDDEDIDNKENRVWRGGSYLSPAEQLRAAYRNSAAVTNRAATIGFRPARTFR